MTPYERTIEFLNDMGIVYKETIHEPNPSYSYKSRYVKVVGYKNNDKDIFGEIYNASLTFVFSINGDELLMIMTSGD